MKRTCPKCGHLTLRIKVNLFLDIDPRAAHSLSKKTCRTKLVRHDGAGWDTALVYCNYSKCGYMMQGI